jgi:SAM-dependent methyltransferase
MKYSVEELKEIYNRNFSLENDQWSVANLNRTCKEVKKVEVFFKQKFNFNFENKKVLDVGCAKGHYSEAFRLAGAHVTGIDISDVALQKASADFPQCTFLHKNGFEPELDEKFDFIWMKGFTGTNTYDMEFVDKMFRYYLEYINEGGFLVVVYNTNLEGRSKENETVNWNYKQFKHFEKEFKEFHSVQFLIDQSLKGIFKYLGFKVLGLSKIYFHIIFQKF